MRKLISAFVGVLLLAGSAATVFVADRQGWLPGSPGRKAGPVVCAHQLAPGACPFCDKGLIAAMGQCAEHSVPEALCWQCNPALVGAYRSVGDWCAGHGVPESRCTICNPGLVAEAAPAATQPSADGIELVPGARAPRHLRAPSLACDKHKLRIRFASPETASQAGLAYAGVLRRKVSEVITCNAELTYNRNRYARLSSRAPGVIQAVRADLGQAVEAGEVLAVVDSPQLGRTKAEFLQARALVDLWDKNHSREEHLHGRGVAAEREMLEARAKLTESRILLSRARQALRNLGLTDVQIDSVAKSKDTSSLLDLGSPFKGRVVERDAVVGENADTTKPLVAVADTSRFWAMLDVHEADAGRVRVGQAAVVSVEAIRGQVFAGRITWVSSRIDSRTRTLKARAEVEDRDGLLRANMFGKAVVTVRDKEPVRVVPKDAVQWEGCCNVVFIRKTDMLFEPRQVRLGYETDRFYVVEMGVEPGETVVTTGSFLLKTEILKGSIGAGCCEVNPGEK